MTTAHTITAYHLLAALDDAMQNIRRDALAAGATEAQADAAARAALDDHLANVRRLSALYA